MEGWVKGAGGSLDLVGDFYNEAHLWKIFSLFFHHLLFAIIRHIYLSQFPALHLKTGQGLFRVQRTPLPPFFFFFWKRKALPGGEV